MRKFCGIMNSDVLPQLTSLDVRSSRYETKGRSELLEPGCPAGFFVRCRATGAYDTTQPIGLALGGIAFGWLLKQGGPNRVFLTCAGVVAVWLAIALSISA